MSLSLIDIASKLRKANGFVVGAGALPPKTKLTDFFTGKEPWAPKKQSELDKKREIADAASKKFSKIFTERKEDIADATIYDPPDIREKERRERIAPLLNVGSEFEADVKQTKEASEKYSKKRMPRGFSYPITRSWSEVIDVNKSIIEKLKWK